jgi:[ribosomal protein S5]-alanine N-acetyltransferase
MDIEPLAVLETERLLFRPHLMGDMDAYCAMEMDADVRRYVGGRPRTRDEAEKRFMGTLAPVTDNLHMWATIYKPEGRYIGRCGIYPHFNDESKPIPGEAALGLYIAKDYWRRGLATEAGRAFVDFGFKKLNINRIVTAIDARNDASVRVIEKLRFTLYRKEEGNLRSFYHYELKRDLRTF